MIRIVQVGMLDVSTGISVDAGSGTPGLQVPTRSVTCPADPGTGLSSQLGPSMASLESGVIDPGRRPVIGCVTMTQIRYCRAASERDEGRASIGKVRLEKSYLQRTRRVRRGLS